MALPYSATLVDIRQETPSVRSFLLDPGDARVEYLPGQWIELTADTVTGPVHGVYSLTTSPTRRGPLGLAVKSSNSHPATRWLHDCAQLGNRVEISDGQGLFVFQPEMAPRVVLVGAGVGVTPLMSIFRFIADSGCGTDATMVYSIPAPDEYLFGPELVELATQPTLRVLVTATQANARDWAGRRGRIDSALLAAAGDTPSTLWYLCGPPGMVEDVSAMLAGLGVPPARVVFEKWW